MPNTNKPKLDKILAWKADKPTTDSDWAEDVKVESFHLKFDKQLKEMKKSLQDKLLHVEKDLDKFDRFPDAIRYELEEQLKEEFSGQALLDIIEEELETQHDYYRWKVEKINQSVERLSKELDLRKSGFLTVLKKTAGDKRFEMGTPESRVIKAEGSRLRAPIGTVYYVDSGCGTPGDGTTATCDGNADDSYDALDSFTEVGRTNADTCIVKRDTTGIDNGSDLNFTSDGTIDNPITIESDYANVWTTDVDLSPTATATLTFGSKTVTFSADISGVLSANDWIYVTAEDQKEFAYEVETVSTNTVTLFLPYKGDQAGSGKTMTNMQATPIWGTVAGDFQWSFNTDHYWKVQGIHIRGTDFQGQVKLDENGAVLLKDIIFEGNGSSARGIFVTDDIGICTILKSRFFNNNNSFLTTSGLSHFKNTLVKDCLIDGNNSSSSAGVLFNDDTSEITFEGTEFKNHSLADLRFLGGVRQATSFVIKGRNLILSSTTPIVFSSQQFLDIFIEDYGGTVGDNRYFTPFGTADNTPFYQSETSTVRSGGSNKSIKVTPSTDLSTNWELSRIKIFEIPFYATTNSKQYEVFFRPTATADWTADPTNTELWIELEYWGHSSNNFRRIIKSTGVIDMNGSTSWVALSVTVTPAQAGVAYLRCYYAKTKEDAKANTFFVDPIPVVI